MSGQETAKSKDVEDHGALATRLRERRRELGLTLKAVADSAGLSVGFISQIERGIAVPSLSSLVSVSRVLDVNVGDFLTSQPQPDENEARSRQPGRPVFAVSESSVTYERVSSSFPGHILRSVIIREPPGYRSEPIAHEGEEMMFVLDGTITIEIDGERTILGTGDSVHFPSTRVHSSWNHTDKPATILWAGTMDVFCEEPATPFHKEKNQKAE
ncbi:cupin domain-containing protein [Nitratireductor sp. XY-223]|uniref:helix-turn-helix domain-containing protein n=1 Tax=Nitratireductor sp. XY-223 TaxID=2561926 RepID=UPI0019822166|nr:cupin domain-containing protein [Nitratireductor sp. XY-223]